MLDYSVLLDADKDVQIKKLLKRHTSGGRSQSDARQKIELIDLPNAELIVKGRHRAHFNFKVVDNE